MQRVAEAVSGPQNILRPQPQQGQGGVGERNWGKVPVEKAQRGREDWGAAALEAAEDLKPPKGFCWFKLTDDLSDIAAGWASWLSFATTRLGSWSVQGRFDGG